MPERAGILISCLKEEADQIRDRARHDHRPVSSYLLKITMRWVQFEERLYVDFARFRKSDCTVFVRHVALPRGPRTATLLRSTAYTKSNSVQPRKSGALPSGQKNGTLG